MCGTVEISVLWRSVVKARRACNAASKERFERSVTVADCRFGPRQTFDAVPAHQLPDRCATFRRGRLLAHSAEPRVTCGHTSVVRKLRQFLPRICSPLALL